MSYYSDNAPALFDQYNRIDPSKLHKGWAEFLPKQPALACDIGAGTGRDSNWLASKGWNVIAVEPEAVLREQAKLQSHANVTWLDDRLPDLSQLRKLSQRFNLILLSAVWMHLPPDQHLQAMSALQCLLKQC